ncbi:flagellar assembly protein FliH [Massilia norwichensis]|uniref:Flagellar assembly protein FliH n=1 Tax=Massilia norwichensis TaxID=1442366 RepID=A0ABT2A5T3_9BURK|nr:flagellar assembly protein FliH [Massilia norwichensis]MCS0589467.1 flagellar assembly protein FliH [Massilia norwichensis]
MVNSKDFQPMFKRWEMTSFGDERPSVAANRRAAEAAEAAKAAEAEAARRAQAVPPPTVSPEELEAIRDAARRQGYAEGHEAGHASGYEDGLAQGRAEAAAELTHLQGIAADFGNAVTQADEAIAADVLELALHLAKNMVRTAFEVRPELILPVVREAVDYLPTLQLPALLVLHPEDALIVRGSIGHELEKTGWRIVEDGTIARGGCRIDTASNQIDAQIAARWQRLSHALGRDVEWLG